MKKNAKRWKNLCQLTEEVRINNKVPGVALGILHNGKFHTAGFGITNTDHPQEVTVDTLFQIGSITKTFTGTLMMKLVERGEIDLDSTVRTYLPEFKVLDEAVSAQVTIRHLLTHTSGWFGDFFHDPGQGEDAGKKYVADMADIEQLAPLGAVWSYNNSGFCLAGHIVEVVTGKSFAGVLREEILGPLGLEDTYFDPGDVITHHFACGHENGLVARPWALPHAVYPAGGITCCVTDLLKYAQFHMSDGGTDNGDNLLRTESLVEMQTPQVKVWKKEMWGLTWEVNETYEHKLVSHDGGTKGQVSQLILVPEKNFAVAVFTNASNGGQLNIAVTRAALKAYLGIEITDPDPIDVDEEILTEYTGTYTRPFMDIHLGLLGGRLVAQVIYKMGFPAQDSPPPPPPQPFSLGLIEEDRLIVLDGLNKSGRAEIIRLDDGSIGWLRYGRIHKRHKD